MVILKSQPVDDGGAFFTGILLNFSLGLRPLEFITQSLRGWDPYCVLRRGQRDQRGEVSRQQSHSQEWRRKRHKEHQVGDLEPLPEGTRQGLDGLSWTDRWEESQLGPKPQQP